ncbi:MAG: hypothetical protein IKM73_13630 [Acidaminococcaceae bacterium]|nr:hypothetical protein [Acidaminococcaceae bacterium]
MAPYNAMLVHIQNPGSVFVASAADWKNRFGRKPKLGARPLVILRPFGPVAFVYDAGDTEGAPLPPEIIEPFRATGTIYDGEMVRFVRSLYFSGFAYVEQDYGTELAGYVQTINSSGTYTRKNTEKEFLLPFGIVVNKNLQNAAKIATIYHELGHVFCGHLPAPELKYLPQRHGLSIEAREFEAESVCWLLCERQGIQNPSAEYLSNYLENNNTIPNISIDTVLKAVDEIEKIWNGIDRPRKELLGNPAQG